MECSFDPQARLSGSISFDISGSIHIKYSIHRQQTSMVSRLNATIVPTGLTLLFLLLSTVPAHGDATVSTMIVKDTTTTFTITPIGCSDGTTFPGGMLTFTYNGVTHLTMTSPTTGHATSTLTGDFTFVTTASVTYTGHLTIHVDFGVASGGTSVITETASLHGTAADGSTIDLHIVAHATMNPDGTVTVTFMTFAC